MLVSITFKEYENMAFVNFISFMLVKL